MTTEEQPTARSDGVSDPDVSRIYRDVATERAPASLNETVLRQAARSGGRGYAHSLVWLRPMAWAATIGVCLAIVLEFADLPQAELGSGHDLATETSSGGDESDAGRSAGAPLPGEDRDAVGDSVPAGSKRIHEPGSAASEQRESAERAAAFHVTETPLLEQAAAAARLRGPSEEATGASTSARAPEAGRGCDTEAIATPESWLECINELRRAGRDDDADAEQRRLVTVFPDFELP